MKCHLFLGVNCVNHAAVRDLAGYTVSYVMIYTRLRLNVDLNADLVFSPSSLPCNRFSPSRKSFSVAVILRSWPVRAL